MPLRTYQQNALDAGIELLNGRTSIQNGAIIIPTGGGKSHVVGAIADEINDAGLILQPSKEILEQNYGKLLNLGRKDVSIYSASLGIKRIDKITLATIGSIYKNPELFKHFKYIAMDECDLADPKGGMYKSLFEAIGRPVCGLTATPWRMHGGHKNRFGGFTGSINKIVTRTKPRIFEDLIHITQPHELYEQGFLCPLEYVEGHFEQGKLTLNSTGADYTDASLKRISNNIRRDAFRSVQLSKQNHHLIFTKLIDDAIAVSDMLNDVGIPCGVVTGEMNKSGREAIIDAFKAGRLKAIANVGVLNVGFDFPQLDHIVLARPTNSARLYYQMLGRGIRIHDSKQKCVLTDLCGNVDRLGKIENWTIRDNEGDKKYRLYNGTEALTGIDLKTGEDLEKPSPKRTDGDVIHFGKHKGKAFPDVPSTYLQWIVDNFSDGVFKNKAKDELTKRALSSVQK